MNTLTIRYKFIRQIVNHIYINANITQFPVDILSIIESFKNIKIISYSTYAKDLNLTKEEFLECFTSDDGFSVFSKSKNKYIIFFNDFIDNSKQRMRWTAAHELGHILCKHHSLDLDNLTNDEIYAFKEREANHFASMLLAHSTVLNELNLISSKDIEFYCDLSSSAAKFRFDNYKKSSIYSTSSDRFILRNFKSFIDSKNQDYAEHMAFLRAFQLY